MKGRLTLALLFVAANATAQSRLADDFERAALEKQIARERDPIALAAAHINLGDLDASRAESGSARRQFAKALAIASEYRVRAHASSRLTEYATATSYAALAAAKLGQRQESFALCEEAIRYLSDSPKIWNVYASSMLVLGDVSKSASAARNAIAIAEQWERDEPSEAHRLDVNIYRYALASALMKSDPQDAEDVLAEILDALRARAFDPLRREIARREAFEVFTSTTNDADAYLSLHNRAGLRLGRLREQRGDIAKARAAYESVLALRSDDPIALAAIARLANDLDEKRRTYAEAFEANPFSMDLVRDYRHFLTRESDRDPGEGTLGARVRRALQLLAKGKRREARAAIALLSREFPKNATIALLMRDAETAPARPAIFASANRQVVEPSEADLRALMDALSADALTGADRRALDAMTFTNLVRFPPAGVEGFEQGSIGAISFRFQQPTMFRGDFASATDLRLEYRILGLAEDELLLEPIRVVTP